jgi:hypothetical protein
MVLRTMLTLCDFTEPWKLPLFRNQSTIVENTRVRDTSEKGAKFSKLKWRT